MQSSWIFSSIVVSVILFQTAPTFGQMIEMTEKPDFSNPDFIYNAFLKDSTEKSFNSLYINALTGYTTNYQYFNLFTRTDYSFARINTAWQHNNFLVEGKVTGLLDSKDLFRDDDGIGNLFKTSLQTSYYFFLGRLAARPKPHEQDSSYNNVNPDLDMEPAIRLRVSWNTEKFERLDRIHRFVVDYDMVFSSDDFLASGGYTFSWRFGKADFLYGLFARYEFPLNISASNRILLGYSVSRHKVNGNDRWGNFKAEGGFATRNLSIKYMYSRELYRRFNNHEICIMANFDLVDRLWFKSKKAGKFISTK